MLWKESYCGNQLMILSHFPIRLTVKTVYSALPKRELVIALSKENAISCLLKTLLAERSLPGAREGAEGRGAV